MYQKLLDRTRRALDVKTLKTIFGRKYRPHNHTKRGSGCRLEKVIERPAYNLTVFKLHFGKLTLKIYDKGDRVLRVEVVAHNVKDLRCGALVEKWPRLLETMEQYLNNFLNIVQAAHVSFLDEGTFDTLAAPTQRGNRRQAGVDFNIPNPTVLRSPIWPGKCRKSPDRNLKTTTPDTRPTICPRSVAKVSWHASASPAVTVSPPTASESWAPIPFFAITSSSH